MLNMASRPLIAARVLVADDQPDVLEALRWLAGIRRRGERGSS
jgi:hypothetical protein